MLTIDAAFRESVLRYPELTALRFFQNDSWREVSYKELNAAVNKTSAGLLDIGIAPGDRVAIISENRPEWVVVYFGINTIGAVAVPIDAQLGEDETEHIIKHSGAETVICSTACYTTVERILSNLGNLKNIIMLDRAALFTPSASTITIGKVNGRETDPQRRFMAFSELLNIGAVRLDKAALTTYPSVDRLASLIYTSGTTGTAKGVMLTHENIMSNIDSISNTIYITEVDGLLLLLPLHHSFPFTACMVWPLTKGASVNFVDIMSRDRTRLIMECRPTIMVGVPLLYSKILRGIMRQVESSFLKSMLMKYGGKKIIGKALKKKLGGRLRYMISGAAPMEPSVIEGFRNLGIEFLEGYGLTETSPVVSVNRPGAAKIASVGPTLPGVEAKIIDPGPDGIGEIAIKGGNVMKGYYNNPEQTDAVLQDGWFRSGDLGVIDEDGYIFITGRAKDVIVTAGGKNVYPEIVEAQILQSTYISECVVIGYHNGTSAENVGVLVYPEFEELVSLAKQDGIEIPAGINPVEPSVEVKETLIKKYRMMLENEVKESMKKLAPFQQASRIGIMRDEFIKTSTRKIKRFLYKGRLDVTTV